MKCEECRELLLEYRDGELDEELAASMQLHLGSCNGCAGELRSLETEGKLYSRYRQALEQDLDVDRAMWDAIRGKISSAAGVQGGSTRSLKDSPSGHWRLGSALRHKFVRQAAMAAALVLISVSATLFAVRYFDRLKRHPVDAGSVSLPSTDTERSVGDEKSLEGAMRAIRNAEHDYIDAIRVLSEIVDKRKPTLDPRLALELERNLKAIDESIEATRKAYYARPSDPYLAQYMLTSYSRKVELLQEIAS